MTLALSVVPSRTVMYPKPPAGSSAWSSYSACGGTSDGSATWNVSELSVPLCTTYSPGARLRNSSAPCASTVPEATRSPATVRTDRAAPGSACSTATCSVPGISANVAGASVGTVLSVATVVSVGAVAGVCVVVSAPLSASLLHATSNMTAASAAAERRGFIGGVFHARARRTRSGQPE